MPFSKVLGLIHICKSFSHKTFWYYGFIVHRHRVSLRVTALAGVLFTIFKVSERNKKQKLF